MDCKIIKYWISLYIDNELDDEKNIILLEHLNKCPECENFFNQCINMDNNIEILFEEKSSNEEYMKNSIIKKIKEENIEVKKKRKSKIAAAVACIIILLFIPINGKSVAALINEWTRSLIVQNDKLVIKVETEVDFSEEYNKKNSDTTKKNGVKKEEPIVITFNNEEEFIEKMNEIDDYPHTSNRLNEDYKFKEGKYEEINRGFEKYSVETRYKKFNTETGRYEDELRIKISYMPENTRITAISRKSGKLRNANGEEIEGEDTEKLVKEAKISGEIGYFESFSANTTLYMFISNYPAQFEIYYCTFEEENGEEELTKIAEDLIDQIKEKVPEYK